jgi:hypothetical protein
LRVYYTRQEQIGWWLEYARGDGSAAAYGKQTGANQYLASVHSEHL